MQNRDAQKQIYGGTYTFREDKHVHAFNGDNLNGVTTLKSKILANHALRNWFTTEPLGVMGWYNPKSAYYQARKENISKDDWLAMKEQKRKDIFAAISSGTYEKYCNLLDMAREATDFKKNNAAEWGSRVHDACEQYIKTGEVTDEHDIAPSVQHFADWLAQTNAKVLHCETNMMSKEWWTGGIVDLILEIDGKLYIADIKTSSGIYSDMFLQMGAYDKMQYEMGMFDKYADGYIIINLKKDHTIATEFMHLTEPCREAYDAIVNLHKSYSTVCEARGEKL